MNKDPECCFFFFLSSLLLPSIIAVCIKTLLAFAKLLCVFTQTESVKKKNVSNGKDWPRPNIF